MDAKEQNEHVKLLRLWATGRATMKQVQRCKELDRKTASVANPVRVKCRRSIAAPAIAKATGEA